MMGYREADSEDVRAAHLAALRLIGFHGGSFAHTCDAATCTRAAHWRYFPEANPLLARVAIPEGGYEVYAVAAPDGRPAAGYGFCLLRLEGRRYEIAGLFGGYAEAVHVAAELGVAEMEGHLDG